MKLYFDVRDIFRAPRLALSGKKIWIFLIGNIIGFAVYWVLSYLALGFSGVGFSEAWGRYGLYPYLVCEPLSWFGYIVYWVGIIFWFFTLNLSCTAVARVTYKQLKGDEFYSSKDAWEYLKKHWHPVIFTSVSILLIVIFFVIMAAVFALFGNIPYLGEFLFALPYLLYFFGSVFTVYTGIVLLISFIYTPAIVAAYEEDTMGTVFQSYSITWSQPWRIILYHVLLLPLAYLGIQVFKLFWIGAFKLINIVFGLEWIHNMFGLDWLTGAKLAKITSWAASVINPRSLCDSVTFFGYSCNELFGHAFPSSVPVTTASLNGTEIAAGVIIAIFLFLLLMSVVSYGLSILSVGETLMFVIFKKRSDDDNLLERKDEEELAEEEEEDEDGSSDEDDSEKETADDNDSDDSEKNNNGDENAASSDTN
ncbi:MAG: hypothetical protein GXO92_05520 [FCB group bacterium]|nr:hypothetical protein [FCB group bacterium]